MTSSAQSTRHRSTGARAHPARARSQPFSAYHPHPASPFARFAKLTSRAAGHPLTFLIAVLIIVVWGITGPLFGFSDT
jgi:hypothetical protein